ncbi:prepilin-type N-terminal cleavage/methylation domain-containing protein [Thermodesulfobacteriota bacterium]
MQRHRINSSSHNGFTLIEITLLIIIISIIAAYAYPRFSAVSDIQLNSALDRLKSDVYYAQELSMTTRTNCGIFVVNSGSYRIYKDGNTAMPALDPATFSNYEITLDSAITIATTAAGAKIEFDNFGVPYDGNGVLVSEVQVILNGSKILKISPQTGWAHL